jgi:glycosyltransferase involved in cell wall biosynthesis
VTPAISVLLPLYRGARHLRATLDALLAQSCPDFEVIAVNDASPDESREILWSYRDPRVTLLDNPVNMGQTASMQRGLAQARGRYVARQDQDDVSLPERFAEQVRFLDARPDIGVVGTNVSVIDEHDAPIPDLGVSYPEETVAELGWRLLTTDRLVDSSVMFRTKAARQVGGFDLEYRYAQDFDLWARLSAETGVARLSSVLLQLRIHRASASMTHADAQTREAAAIVERNVNRVLPAPIDLETAALVTRVLEASVAQPRDDVWRCLRVLDSTIDPYCRQRHVDGRGRTAVAAAFVETAVKLGLRHRRTLGATLPLLISKAAAKSPAVFLNPARLAAWWTQGRQARRYRAAIGTLSE